MAKPKIVPAITCDGVEAVIVFEGIPLSFIFRTGSPNRLSPLFFSLVESAVILIDHRGHIGGTLAATQSYLSKLDYKRIPLGTGWYWRPGRRLIRAHLRDIGFFEKGQWVERWGRECLANAGAATDPKKARALRRRGEMLIARAKLAFSGIEPVKCQRWEHLILRREQPVLAGVSRKLTVRSQ